jgi:hypothetical protein
MARSPTCVKTGTVNKSFSPDSVVFYVHRVPIRKSTLIEADLSMTEGKADIRHPLRYLLDSVKKS